MSIDTSQFTSNSLEDMQRKQQEYLDRKKNGQKTSRQKQSRQKTSSRPQLSIFQKAIGRYGMSAPSAIRTKLDIDPLQANQLYFRILTDSIGTMPILTDNAKKILSNLVLYFINHPDSLYDLDRGIYLYGPYGTGKTTVMRCFQRFTDMIRANRFRIVDYKTLVRSIKNKGNTKSIDIGSSAEMLYDDLGFKNRSEIKIYGNIEDVVEEIIYHRYNRYKQAQLRTFFTSNIFIKSNNQDVPSIHKKFGEGVSSRLIEMVTPIFIGGKNHRITNT